MHVARLEGLSQRERGSLTSDVRSQTRMEVSTCQTLVPAAIGSAANKPLPCTALRLTSTFTFQPKFFSFAVTSFTFPPEGAASPTNSDRRVLRPKTFPYHDVYSLHRYSRLAGNLSGQYAGH